MPDHVGEAPRPRAVALDRINDRKEIAPPHVAAPDDHVLKAALVPGGLFIVSDMEETRPVEDLADVGDNLRAYPPVAFSSHQRAVFVEPAVVPAGEIQLRHRLDPERAQTPDLLAHPFGSERPLRRQFRMARIDERFAEINNRQIQPLACHRIRPVFPDGKIGAHLVRRPANDRLFPPIAERLAVLPVAPHIHPEMQQIAPNESTLRRTRYRRIRDPCASSRR